MKGVGGACLQSGEQNIKEGKITGNMTKLNERLEPKPVHSTAHSVVVRKLLNWT